MSPASLPEAVDLGKILDRVIFASKDIAGQWINAIATYLTRSMVDNVNRAVVVVPTYKDWLTPDEKIAVTQLGTVMQAHEKVVVYPEGLDVRIVEDLIPADAYERFPSYCFSAYESYNRTLLSSFFYERFLSYEFVLLYQLDAFIFSDSLDYWCGLGYDYVGAPLGPVPGDAVKYCEEGYWPVWQRSAFIRRLTGSQPSDLLNGGLSLRRVSTFYEISSLYGKKVDLWARNEDLFWSCAAAAYRPKLRIPGPEVNARFSLMIDCEEWIGKTGQLPFGCHGWAKYEREFWKPRIERFGYRLD